MSFRIKPQIGAELFLCKELDFCTLYIVQFKKKKCLFYGTRYKAPGTAKCVLGILLSSVGLRSTKCWGSHLICYQVRAVKRISALCLQYFTIMRKNANQSKSMIFSIHTCCKAPKKYIAWNLPSLAKVG